MKKIGRNTLCPCGSGSKYKKCCLKNESSFIFSKEVYEDNFYSYYDPDIREKLKTIITFEDIVLPFYIPFDRGQTVTLSMGDDQISFRFDKVVTNESYKYPVDLPSSFDIFKSKVTMIAATTLALDNVKEKEEYIINEYFEKLLIMLNKLISSYIVMSKDDRCHYLTKEMFPITVLNKFIDIEEWKSERYLFNLHPNIPYNHECFKPEDIPELTRHIILTEENLNPFMSSDRQMLFAKKRFKDGFYHEAVIYAQISIEVFIEYVYRELLKEADGLPDEEIDDAIEKTPFMTIVKSKLHNYLGGDWDLKNQNSPAGKWDNKTYKIRNQAVHGGKIPSFNEADEAIETATDFKEFILKRIEKNKSKYPELVKYFLF